MTVMKNKFCAAALAGVVLLAGCGEAVTGEGYVNSDGIYAGYEVVHGNGALEGNVGDVSLQPGDEVAVITIAGYGDITVKLFPDIAPLAVENFKQLAASGYYDGKNIHRVMTGFMFQGGSSSGTGLSSESGPSFGVEVNPNARHFYGALCMANSAATNSEQFYIVNSTGTGEFSALKEDFESLEAAVAAMADEIENAEELYGAEVVASYSFLQYVAQYNHYRMLAEFVGSASDQVVAKYGAVGGAAYLDGGYTVFGQTVSGWDVIEAVSAVSVEDDGSGNVTKPVTEILIEKVTVTLHE